MPKRVIIQKRDSPKNNSFQKTKPNVSLNNTNPNSAPAFPISASAVSAPKKSEKTDVNSILVENLIGLQKVTINLSIKLDALANQISQLLALFEISAKSIAERGGDIGGGYDKRIMEKLDNVMDQNKTIARGIALLHEPGQSAPQAYSSMPIPKSQSFSLPPPGQIASPDYEQVQDFAAYQKSISSKPSQFNKLPQG